MKMKLVLCFLLAGVLLAGTSCGKDEDRGQKPDPAEPIELTTRQLEKTAGDNAFSLDLFREVAASKDKENAFISPLSVTMALGMLYNGTSPDAGAEMAAALKMTGYTDTEINEYYRTMARALLSVDPLTAISIANSIWYRDGFPVKQAFIDLNKTYYDAVMKGPFTVEAINRWCADRTNDKIKTIIDEIPAEAVMYLINAVYFKSKWMFEFDKKNTRDENFTLEGGARKKLAMMNQEATLPYYADEALQCVDLPYGNGAFSMSILLPAEGKTVDDIVNRLDYDAWAGISAGLRESNVQVKLPRFKQECRFILNEPVQDLGMNRIFAPGNLSGIADDSRLAVSRIIHKTFVEVNEEGTEAAAVTAVETYTTSGFGPSYIPFHADRPFIYLIREQSTGAILFIGRMDNPQS